MTYIIKKYPNRRLYDTQLGKYITLDDVKELVLQNIEFTVIDARTKKDITQSTLLQIITEQESSQQNPLFTTKLLENFIRFYNEKSQGMVSEYLEKMTNLYAQQKDFFQKQWQAYENFFTKNDDKKKQDE